MWMWINLRALSNLIIIYEMDIYNKKKKHEQIKKVAKNIHNSLFR